MTYDAVFILGGGVRSNGILPLWVQRRFEYAIECTNEEPLVCLSAGTTHRPPPTDQQGFPLFESYAGAKYLLQRSVAAERIYSETASWDTIGNAYFSRLLFAQAFGWKHLLIVTSEFHMSRTRLLFEWIYGMKPAEFRLDFAATPDEGLDEDSRRARVAKEAEGIERSHPLIQSISTLDHFQRWLYSEHRAYSAERQCQQDCDPRPHVLTSY